MKTTDLDSPVRLHPRRDMLTLFSDLGIAA